MVFTCVFFPNALPLQKPMIQESDLFTERGRRISRHLVGMHLQVVQS